MKADFSSGQVQLEAKNSKQSQNAARPLSQAPIIVPPTHGERTPSRHQAPQRSAAAPALRPPRAHTAPTPPCAPPPIGGNL